MTAQTSRWHRAAIRTSRIVSFVGFFAFEFLRSNAQVLVEIFRPRRRGLPAVVAVPLRATRNVEIVSVSNLIALTPGTLTLEVALDPPTLYVHGMFAHAPEAFVADLHDLEDRLLAAMRPVDREPDPAGHAERARRAGVPEQGWSQ